MYKLTVKDNFSEREYDIEKRKGITVLAQEYGRTNDTVMLYDSKGEIIDACRWNIETKKYDRIMTK
jgi:hypothetical protein